jgi:predicted dehydrogenase
MSRLRFGMIGCGRFAREFVRYVREVGDVVWAADPDARSVEAMRAMVGGNLRLAADYQGLLSRKHADAVIVTTPNDLHADATIAAAQAGLHVFCEKPMALTLKQCQQMVQTCNAHNVKLMIGHKRRLRPAWARMIELTREHGPLGPARAITVAAYADYRSYEHQGTWWAQPERSGGFLHVHAVHVIDWLAAMCGQARDATAVSAPRHNPTYRDPDILHATYRFHAGAIATVTTSSLFPLHKYRESHGPWGQCRDGGFIFEPASGQLNLRWQRLDDDQPHNERFTDLGFDEAYRREITDFVRWVSEERTPCLTWVEGLHCVAMMEAANLSAARGGELVAVPTYSSE